MSDADPPGHAGLRASDADRERIADTLAEALSEGRLTAEEHGARLDAAYAARLCGELDAVVADLPGGVPQDLAVANARRPERQRSWITGIAALGVGVARLLRSVRSRHRGGMTAERAAARRLQRQQVNAARRERRRALRQLHQHGQWDRRMRRRPRRRRSR
jgi:Domain of unknown function (DUF1707)